MAIQAGKHVVLPLVNALGAAELHALAERARRDGVIAAVDQPWHWTDEAFRLKSLIDSGDLGQLRRIRLASHEFSLPGEAFPQGVLRELGWHWIDQLLSLLGDDAKSVQLRTFADESKGEELGFLAMIEFSKGASAVIELQTRSLLSLHTGWLLEGTSGAYRDGRKYLMTSDGEIVDEAVERPAASDEPFLDLLAAALRGDKDAKLLLPGLSRPARTAALIEKLEESAIRC
jgi:predicted dehydrogenase